MKTPRHDRRGDPQRHRLPVSGDPLRPPSPRELGRHRLSGSASRARRFLSARGFSRSWTASMRSPRIGPYRRALSTEAALDILRERSGTMYDPRVVEKFIEIHPKLTAALADDTPPVPAPADVPVPGDAGRVRSGQCRHRGDPASRRGRAEDRRSGPRAARLVSSGSCRSQTAAVYAPRSADDLLEPLLVTGPHADLFRRSQIRLSEGAERLGRGARPVHGQRQPGARPDGPGRRRSRADVQRAGRAVHRRRRRPRRARVLRRAPADAFTLDDARVATAAAAALSRAFRLAHLVFVQNPGSVMAIHSIALASSRRVPHGPRRRAGLIRHASSRSVTTLEGLRDAVAGPLRPLLPSRDISVLRAAHGNVGSGRRPRRRPRAHPSVFLDAARGRRQDGGHARRRRPGAAGPGARVRGVRDDDAGDVGAEPDRDREPAAGLRARWPDRLLHAHARDGAAGGQPAARLAHRTAGVGADDRPRRLQGDQRSLRPRARRRRAVGGRRHAAPHAAPERRALPARRRRVPGDPPRHADRRRPEGRRIGAQRDRGARGALGSRDDSRLREHRRRVLDPRRPVDVAAFIDRADVALYRAKQDGRNAVQACLRSASRSRAKLRLAPRVERRPVRAFGQTGGPRAVARTKSRAANVSDQVLVRSAPLQWRATALSNDPTIHQALSPSGSGWP